MSRVAFIFGLLASVALHVWLLSLPGSLQQEIQRLQIPIIETELAMLEPPPEAARPPEPEATPEPPRPPVAPEPEPPAPEPPAPEPPKPAPPEEPPPPQPPQQAPPQPPMQKMAEPPKALAESTGDFAGSTEGSREPELRIDWGSAQEALSVLEAGQMVVVVLRKDEGGPVITQELEAADGSWRRRTFRPRGPTRYSNRLRIVDQVPAFSPLRSAAGLGAGELLAVLVPTQVEHMLGAAQLRAAFDRGLTMRQIDNLAGRFAMRQGRLDFDVTHVGSINRNATP